MTNGLFTTGVGLVPHLYKQEIIANNLANVNTTGYKKDGLLFKRVLEAELFQQMEQGDSELMMEIQAQYTDFQPGSLVSTGNHFDVAIDGEGFFVVETPTGLAYTRNGNFTINPDGVLVNNVGYPVLGEDGTIEIDKAEEIVINEQGEIIINGAQNNKLAIVNFKSPDMMLKKLGNSLFVPRNDGVEQQPVEQVKIKQGYLEQSNVNPIKEMVEMIITLRSFESIQKTMRLQNETLSKTVNDLGRVK